MLATLAQFKTRYGVPDATDDTMLTAILTNVSAQLALAAGRVANGAPCLEKTTLTGLLVSVNEPRCDCIVLPAWPVISITSIKEAMYEDFASATALVEKTDYQVNKPLGLLFRIGYWLRGVNTVQITLAGGYTAAGDTPGVGETALPADITEAAIEQAGFTWQRRDKLGLTGAGMSGGSFSAYAQDTLLPGVRETMARYARRIA